MERSRRQEISIILRELAWSAAESFVFQTSGARSFRGRFVPSYGSKLNGAISVQTATIWPTQRLDIWEKLKLRVTGLTPTSSPLEKVVSMFLIVFLDIFQNP